MLNYLLKKTGLKADEQENEMLSSDLEKPHVEERGTQTTPPPAAVVPGDEIKAGKPLGIRVSGKQWKESKKPLRMGAVSKSSWEKKRLAKLEIQATKAKEKELKEEKEAEKQARIKSIKEKKAAKEEKERYAKLAEKMHAKKVARLRKREKRNKLLKER